MNRQQFHFIGIGGIGMSGLARLLISRGATVSGSDLKSNYTLDGLIEAGAQIHIGHNSEQLPAGATVVYTTGIDERNPEWCAAKNQGHHILHRSDLLAVISEGHESIAIAGMHGKTTTSSLLTEVLMKANIDPSFAIGGIVRAFGVNARQGKGSHFVFEACESDGSFVKYHPLGAIITNIDREHMDHYVTEDRLMEGFATFISHVQDPNMLFWCGDDQRLKSLSPPGISYGFSEDCQVRIVKMKQSGWTLKFDLQYGNQLYQDITAALSGRHNALNAAAVFAMALKLGVEESVIREALLAFQGIGRRCERRGSEHGVLLIDDYAHHPVEIQTTLKGIREAIGPRRLIAIYQPHRFTRTRDCLGMYLDVFKDVDELILTDIFAASESPIEGVNINAVYADISGSNNVILDYIPRGQLVDALVKRLKLHDVVVTLGAGDITSVSKDIVNRLSDAPLPKLKVGLIYGGRSAEHEVSLMSARNISAALSKKFYEIEYFAIDKQGYWIAGDEALTYLNTGQLVCQEQGNLISSSVLQRLEACDVAFPILHGPYGEDGTIQGFFEMLNLPYVGCDWRASAITMDKAVTKALMQAYGIPTLDFISFSRDEWQNQSDKLMKKILEQFSFPIFVKPTHLGSSIGTGGASDINELNEAIENAFKFDTNILIEPKVDGREIEFSLLGNANAIAFPPGEIFSEGSMYDYEGKYGSNSTVKVSPQADLPDDLSQQGQELALAAFRAVGGRGMARIDFFLDRQNRWWLNEINPIPGFTNNSAYPRMCEVNGIAQSELIDQLIQFALQRHALKL